MRQFDVDTWYNSEEDCFVFSKEIFLSGKPISITIEVSDYCNLTCDYCLSDSGPRRKREAIPARVIQRLKELSPFKAILAGGEPFLLPNIEDVVMTLYGGGCSVYVSTNGTYIPDCAVPFVDNFDVHVDGTTEEVYSISMGKSLLKVVKRNIEQLVEKGAQVRVNCVVNKNNYDNAFTMPEFCRQLGVRRLEMIRTLPIGRASNEDLSVSEDSMLTLQEAFKSESDIAIHFMYANPDRLRNEWFSVYPVFNGSGQLLRLPDHIPTNITLFDDEVKGVFDRYKEFLHKSPRAIIKE